MVASSAMLVMYSIVLESPDHIYRRDFSMCTDMSHDSGSQCMRMEDIQLTSKNTICIEYRSTQTQIQQDHSAKCGVLIGADKVLKEECNASDLTQACSSYLRQ